RLNEDGSLDPSLQAEPTFEERCCADIATIAIQRDGKVLLGGFFSKAKGLNRTNLARLNTDGTVDMQFQSTVGAVSCLAVQRDGKILVSSDNGGVVRLNADGSLDSS